MKEITVGKEDASQRLDRFLRKALPQIPLSGLYKAMRKGRIKLNGKKAKPETTLCVNDRLTVFFSNDEFAKPKRDLSFIRNSPAFKEYFHLLWEDEHFLALDKPAGISVHPGTGSKFGQTLIEMAWAYLECPEAHAFRPSLIHRIDKDTSGLLLVAKTGEALRKLTEMIRAGSIKKEYLALVIGKLAHKSGKIEEALVRVPDSFRGGKVITAETEAPSAKHALTEYLVKETFHGFSLVRIILKTGRTHQIRVHFASQNHPVAGDEDYGNPNLNKFLLRNTGLNRQFLHASKLTFIHPVHGTPLCLEAPIPPDLESCLQALKKLENTKEQFPDG